MIPILIGINTLNSESGQARSTILKVVGTGFSSGARIWSFCYGIPVACSISRRFWTTWASCWYVLPHGMMDPDAS